MDIDKSLLESNNKAHSPASVTELEAFLAAVHENQTGIRGWTTSASTGHIEVDTGQLSVTALPSIYLVPKQGRFAPLKSALDRIFSNSTSGYPPSPGDAYELWQMLDATSSMR